MRSRQISTTSSCAVVRSGTLSSGSEVRAVPVTLVRSRVAVHSRVAADATTLWAGAGVEDVAVWSGEAQGAVGLALHLPVGVVDEPVVERAQMGAVVQAGESAAAPPDDVVQL